MFRPLFRSCPFFGGRNVWTTGGGVNSLSIVGRLSTLQSVHYQRFHCIPFWISLSMQPPFLPEIIPDMLVVSTHYCYLYCSQLQNLMQKLLLSCLPTMTQTNNTTTSLNNQVTTVNKQQRKKTNSLVQQPTKTRIFKNLRLPLRKTRECVQRLFPSQPREQ